VVPFEFNNLRWAYAFRFFLLRRSRLREASRLSGDGFSRSS
jgi:hypothetical protein